MANYLPVTYVSQLGGAANEHNNDCGAASSLMLLKSYSLCKDMTVDTFYNLVKPSGDTALRVGELQIQMAGSGLKNTWKVGMTLTEVFANLHDKIPMIALIHYAPLVDAGLTERTGFRGAHFVVITGIDLDNIFINDPYRTDNKAHLSIPIDIFEKAWDQCILDDNPVRGAIIPIYPIQDLSTSVPVENGEYPKQFKTNTMGLAVYRNNGGTLSVPYNRIIPRNGTPVTVYAETVLWARISTDEWVRRNYLTRV